MGSWGQATVDILGVQGEDQTQEGEEGSSHGLIDPGAQREEQEIHQEEDPSEEEDHLDKEESGVRSFVGSATTRGHQRKHLRATTWPGVAG